MRDKYYFQDDAQGAVWGEWRSGNRKTLLILPTGTGKTHVFSKISADEVASGGRVLILAHTDELCQQAADKLYKVTGLKAAIEKAEQTCFTSWRRVVVGSKQSLERPKRLSKFPTDYFTLIIVDEVHRSLAEGYLRILNYFEASRQLGVTATPDRADMRNLGQYWDSIAYEYTLPQAIKDGVLCPIKAQTIPLKIDLSAVSQSGTGGDFTKKGLGSALDPYLNQIAEEMLHYCADRKTIVFLPLIATSKKFCDILHNSGFRSIEINGKSEDRKDILKDYHNNEYNVLCNSMLLTEGFDEPSIDCVVILRATKSRPLYCQMVGRGTRICEGKKDLLLLDFLWHTNSHELCRPAHLIAESITVAQKMTENIAEAGCPVDIIEAEVKAESDCIMQREEALAKKLGEMKKRKRSLVDPLQFEMSIQAEDLANYVPAFGWEAGPASEAQVKQLEKAGIFPDEIDCAGKASKLIDRIQKRRVEGLTTPKQIRYLEKKGFQHVGTWQFDSAQKLISRIAANGHRTPHTIEPYTYRPTQQPSTGDIPWEAAV